MQDWISLIECGYDLEGNLDGWLTRVVSTAVPLIDCGGGVAGILFDANGGRFRLRHVCVRGGDRELGVHVRAANDEAPMDGLAAVYASGHSAGTLSETVFPSVAGEQERFWNASA